MTLSIAGEIAKRVKKTDQPRRNGAEDLAQTLREALAIKSEIRFPSPRYQADPVAFCREILGIEPWRKQIEILEAIRDNKRVAVRSGHKVGKSASAVIAALWYYCSFPDARVVMTSTTARQVDQILWRELRMFIGRGAKCVACKAADPHDRQPRPCPHSARIDGELNDTAKGGMKSSDFREIVGFTAREAEAVAGISGKNLLYIVDEASGVPDIIYEAIEGNRAGGARIVMFSNPTKNEGEFFAAFETKKALYATITVSSEETPNVVEGRMLIDGLAERSWIEEKKEEWGEESPLYKIRVKGIHVEKEAGKIFSLQAIIDAERRWIDAPEAGRLFIGLDPAGESGTGDETVFAPRRGLKTIGLYAHRGLTAEGHLAHLLAMIDRLKLVRETPVVVLDGEGKIGAEVYGTLRSFLNGKTERPFDLVRVRSSERAMRQPMIYDRVRDELAGNLENAFRDGASIPEDAKLSRELHALEWEHNVRGRQKVTPKDKLRKILERSPDRYDALALAYWEPLSLTAQDATAMQARASVVSPNDTMYAMPALDPYAGAAAFGGGQ